VKIAVRILATAMLLSGTILLAQTEPDHSPSKTDDSAQASPEQNPFPRVRGIVEILSDTKGVDFRPYVREVVHTTQHNWRALTEDSSRFGVAEPTQVAVEFSIQRDGTVSGMKLVNASSNEALNQAARDAVANSSPLPALPDDFPEQHLELRVHFRARLNHTGEQNGGLRSRSDNSANNTGGMTDCCPPEEENGVYRSGSRGVSNPKAIYAPSPAYGEKSRKKKLQGTVILQIVVTAQGTARDITVQKSLSPDLDQSAVNTVSKWKFEPAMKDGQPVAVRISVEVSFKLY
jgi:TonB family protein